MRCQRPATIHGPKSSPRGCNAHPRKRFHVGTVTKAVSSADWAVARVASNDSPPPVQGSGHEDNLRLGAPGSQVSRVAGPAGPGAPGSQGRQQRVGQPSTGRDPALHAAALCRVLHVPQPLLMSLVARCPALFAFTPEALDTTVVAIAGLTGLQTYQVSQLVAADPELLLQPDRLKANMRGLAQALGVSPKEVGAMAAREPAVLALSGQQAEDRLRALGESLLLAAGRHEPLVAAVLQSPGVLLVPEPEDVEARLQELESTLELVVGEDEEEEEEGTPQLSATAAAAGGPSTRLAAGTDLQQQLAAPSPPHSSQQAPAHPGHPPSPQASSPHCCQHLQHPGALDPGLSTSTPSPLSPSHRPQHPQDTTQPQQQQPQSLQPPSPTSAHAHSHPRPPRDQPQPYAQQQPDPHHHTDPPPHQPHPHHHHTDPPPHHPLRRLVAPLVLSKPSLLTAPPARLASRAVHLATKAGVTVTKVLVAAASGPNLLAALPNHIEGLCTALASLLDLPGGIGEAMSIFIAAPSLLSRNVNSLGVKWHLLTSLLESHHVWKAWLATAAPYDKAELLALPYTTVARLRFLVDLGLQSDMHPLEVVRASDPTFQVHYPGFQAWLRS